jgi:hypothetical protein
MKPTLKDHYSAVRQRQRPRAYPDPSKRKPDHYKWFVLSVCAGLNPGEIANKLSLPVQEDAVRKGIKSVRDTLGLSRK